MPDKLESPMGKIPDVLAVNEKPKETHDNTPVNEYHPERIKTTLNPVERLLNRNLDAKKKLANELMDMGLSKDEILKILWF